jgi:serine/threonine-protein kinase HipA
MNCLFTYKPLKVGEENYSVEGLKSLSPKLTGLKLFPYSSAQQLIEAQRMAGKISIQGVQPKLSVQLSIKEQVFEIVERGGTYIVKPPTPNYPEMPENEDLTMHLADIAGFQVPWHGLIRAEDDRLSYVIKRFDRKGKRRKVPQEDFAQLMGATSTTKYEASMEKVAEIIEEFCTFKTLDCLELFRRTIFCFLVGNEDMHLKNFSVTTMDNGRVRLTPLYDCLNSTIATAGAEEELALPIDGNKRGFNRRIFIDKFAVPHLYIPSAKAGKEIDQLLKCIPEWKKMIDASFLSEPTKAKYSDLIDKRAKRLS